jgi:hypothetical protein
MHGPINVKFPNNISKWQMGFNSAFKGLIPLKTNSTLTFKQKITVSEEASANTVLGRNFILHNRTFRRVSIEFFVAKDGFLTGLMNKCGVLKAFL